MVKQNNINAKIHGLYLKLVALASKVMSNHKIITGKADHQLHGFLPPVVVGSSDPEEAFDPQCPKVVWALLGQYFCRYLSWMVFFSSFWFAVVLSLKVQLSLDLL